MEANEVSSPFDGLAEKYDRSRPRYPDSAFKWLDEKCCLSSLESVIDIGAGTGIVLEGLTPFLKASCSITAIDVSKDMTRVGEEKFPSVTWLNGEAESLLHQVNPANLIIAGQSYQWLDRERFVDVAWKSLVAGGSLVVLQNNRNFARGEFASAYEDLLEEWSPGYRRNYRQIDICNELGRSFSYCEMKEFTWEDRKTCDEFVTLSSSSTQSRRALRAWGTRYEKALNDFVESWIDDQGYIYIPYVTEVYIAWK